MPAPLKVWYTGILWYFMYVCMTSPPGNTYYTSPKRLTGRLGRKIIDSTWAFHHDRRPTRRCWSSELSSLGRMLGVDDGMGKMCVSFDGSKWWILLLYGQQKWLDVNGFFCHLGGSKFVPKSISICRSPFFGRSKNFEAFCILLACCTSFFGWVLFFFLGSRNERIHGRHGLNLTCTFFKQKHMSFCCGLGMLC